MLSSAAVLALPVTASALTGFLSLLAFQKKQLKMWKGPVRRLPTLKSLLRSKRVAVTKTRANGQVGSAPLLRASGSGGEGSGTAGSQRAARASPRCRFLPFLFPLDGERSSALGFPQLVRLPATPLSPLGHVTAGKCLPRFSLKT